MLKAVALDAVKIMAAMSSRARSGISRLEVFSILDSTNTYLLQETQVDTPSGWVCFADQQTQGRGRQGKTWHSPAGSNIYGSLLWRFSPDYDLSGLSLAIAVMLVEALQHYGMPTGIQLKWPNDIWFAGRKLGGILLEQAQGGVVIGFGLNLRLPRDTHFSPAWIDIHEITGNIPQRNHLIGLLLDSLFTQLPVFATQGVVSFLSRWRNYDVLYQRHIDVQAGQRKYSGIVQGINEQGALLLCDDQGVMHTFYGAEVTLSDL
ncbi:MAG: biotin--[acetyl-CoA-carboxylase] ligase [Gammaproteobacteria bacterium RIFCSPHIGHO2_12_FULL_41_20]|nr:MAG: biotin--[acetyl-CoA-carboxylase] ligase [Gammaproteobacteria bacterium RIFCSPHIGHO2_12_FULL_41_20]